MTLIEFLDKHAEGIATMITVVIVAIFVFRPMMKDMSK